jgi:osmotically-inducible protein OsmY
MLATVPISKTCCPTFSPLGAAAPTRGEGPSRPAAVEADRILFEAIVRALRSTGYAALRDLEIEITGRVVVLWGQVPSYYQKQLAQETAQHVCGAGRVANGIEVSCCRKSESQGKRR